MRDAVQAAVGWSSGLERMLPNHASDATYSVADNRIVSVGTAELRRQRISHA